MFDTKYSDYNIVKATPFKRDVVKELADACAKHGIKLHFYYSHIDWYREDAPQGRTGRGTGRPNPKGDWKSYYQFMNNQLTELLTIMVRSALSGLTVGGIRTSIPISIGNFPSNMHLFIVCSRLAR